MLELSLHLVIADDTSTDEALIAGLSHDLRAIAAQVAEAWPGIHLDEALGDHGQLVRPVSLDLELAHGGRARLEVRQRATLVSPPSDRPFVQSSPRPPVPVSAIEPLLEALTPPERWRVLREDATFQESIAGLEQVLAAVGGDSRQSTRRLLQTVAGTFRDLEAKDRSGAWVSVAATPATDPYYVCAAFDVHGRVNRVPLPQLFPEAAALRRSYRSSPEQALLIALIERTAPDKLEAVREAGRALLDQRRRWMTSGQYRK